MFDKTREKKNSQDVTQVSEDLRNLQNDATAQVTSVIDNVTQSAEDLTTRLIQSVSLLSEGIEKLKGDAAETVMNASANVKKGVGQGLTQYNARANEVAGKVPGGLAKKAAMYPWVAMSITLIAGLVLGSFLKPGRRPVGLFSSK
ncbi:MAG TPA: hypothetical protein PJ988_01745 [Anaerolinea sp.]|nr:hypothetical protein [Anaerolinea sp.]